MRNWFLRWTQGSTKDRVINTDLYRIDQYKLPDETMVQWRSGSGSGGATIEVKIPGMLKPEKVQIDGKK